jgi:hypothetical protein
VSAGANDDGICRAQQVPALRLGKVQAQQCDKRDKNPGWVYNSFQQGFTAERAEVAGKMKEPLRSQRALR